MQRLLSQLVLSFALACSSSSPTSDAGAADAGAEGEAGPTACEALTTSLQAAIDGARTSPNAIVAASTAECPSIVVASGAAATGDIDSLWRLASITKTWVSATILSLATAGKLGLDDTLAQWVPNVPNTTGVTVRMMLNHTSGIFNFNDDTAFNRTTAWTPQQLVQMGTSHPMYFAAGTGFHYSNTDYVLLGLVAEAAGTTTTISPLLHEYAIDNAKLSATFFSGEETPTGTPAHGFESGNDITNVDLSYATWTAGSMVGTAADTVKWVRELYATSDVLDSSQASLLITNPASWTPGVHYGLGVTIWDSFYKGEKAIGHAGDTTGFHAWALWFPNRNIAFVAIVNDETTPVDAVGHAALDVLLALAAH